jgi:hypothetical protein
MEEINGYYDDDGNKLNPDRISKPGLCLICKKDTDPDEEILCNLNRLDPQNEKEFIYYAFEKTLTRPC